MAERYTVVFFGETLKGFDAAVVQAAMGEQFRLPPAQLAQLFSGRAVPLKKDLDADAAQRFVDAMSTLGAKVELQSALDGTCAAADGAGVCC
ncbi:MAG: hypothetical protein HOI95_24805 [Chromatiales bacterium]|jgi:hypothetical protein|nr:hypothetical protein [Chromatiales bacterium]